MTMDAGRVGSLAEDQIGLSRVKLIKKLGKGDFGKVYLAKTVPEDNTVAIKIQSRASHLQEDKEMFRTEFSILRKLKHSNIVKAINIGETERALVYMLLEYVEGCTLDILCLSRGYFTEEEVREIMHQAVSALAYIHSLNICHRDVKPRNLMLSSSGQLKLIDFGLATTFTPGKTMTKFVSTLPFMAPEALDEQRYTPVVDTWSLGVVLHKLLAGNLPFNGCHQKDLLKNIYLKGYNPPPTVSLTCKNLLLMMLNIDPNERFAMSDIINDQWMNKSETALHPDNEETSIPTREKSSDLALEADQKTEEHMWECALERKQKEKPAEEILLEEGRIHLECDKRMLLKEERECMLEKWQQKLECREREMESWVNRELKREQTQRKLETKIVEMMEEEWQKLKCREEMIERKEQQMREDMKCVQQKLVNINGRQEAREQKQENWAQEVIKDLETVEEKLREEAARQQEMWTELQKQQNSLQFQEMLLEEQRMEMDEQKRNETIRLQNEQLAKEKSPTKKKVSCLRKFFTLLFGRHRCPCSSQENECTGEDQPRNCEETESVAHVEPQKKAKKSKGNRFFNIFRRNRNRQ